MNVRTESAGCLHADRSTSNKNRTRTCRSAAVAAPDCAGLAPFAMWPAIFCCLGAFCFFAVPSTVQAQIPDHPVLTEVYTDPTGVDDGPIGRDPANQHQEYVEIWLPTQADLSPSLNPSALNLTFYEVEGDSTSSGTALVNYRFDLPTLCVLNNPAACPSNTIARPPTGVVVLGWVDYNTTTPPPTGLGGTPASRLALVNGGIVTDPGDYVFLAMNGRHFEANAPPGGGGTTNFPVLLAENFIDHACGMNESCEAQSGVIQNGSSAYLLVNRDSSGYVELCDDKHATDCAAGADPNLPNNAMALSTSALLDGFAGNDDSLFDVFAQPLPLGTCPSNCHNGCSANCLDHQMMLYAGGAFSLLIPQIPEESTDQPNPGIANGYARRFVDVAKTTENGTPADDNPVTDALNAYRHIRNGGPFVPTPGRAVLTTSPPELGLATSTTTQVQVLEILTETTREAEVLAANVGGNFNINITPGNGVSSNPAVATFNAGTAANNVPGQSFGLPTIEVTGTAGAADGAVASATVPVLATNSNAGDPAVLNPSQAVIVSATAINPPFGMNASGQPFETTVFLAVQGVPPTAATNELLGTDFGAYVAANLGTSVFGSITLAPNATTLINPSSNMQNGPFVQSLTAPFPGGGCCINSAGAAAGDDLFQTVSNSAEVVGGTGSYVVDPGCSECGGGPPGGVDGIEIRFSTPAFPAPDLQVFDGPFSPSETLHFANGAGGVNTAGSPLNNVTTSRTFELAIVDTNVRFNGTLESGNGDDFGLLLRVANTEVGSPFSDGEWIFLSFTGGFEGADIDSLNVPPNSPGNNVNILNIVYVDLDNLHNVLGIKTISRVVLIDGDGGNEIDPMEVFNLNPVGVVVPVCGDGNVDPGEQCDDGNANNNDNCTNACQNPACGDGFVHNQGTPPFEECDDGNNNSGDGCSATCIIEFCGDNVVNNIIEQCDEGGVDTPTCDSDCSNVICGDNHVNMPAGEQCDDGNNTSGDGCSATCVIEFCGDGVTNNGTEQCDDGGVDTANCDSDCTFVVCGDNHLNVPAGEQCDDGNNNPGDGCDPNCQTEPAGCQGPQDCDDGLPCTLNVCNMDGSCSNPPGNSGVVCRAAMGVCDIQEVCDGVNPQCPADAFDAVFECRPAAGQCDVAEFCDGTGPNCPTDQCLPVMTVCDFAGVGDGVCVSDPLGGCACAQSGCVDDAACDDNQLCTVEFCDGGVCVGKSMTTYGDINNDGFPNADDVNCLLDAIGGNLPSLGCCDRTFGTCTGAGDVLPQANFQKRDLVPCPTDLVNDPNNMGDGFENADDVNGVLDVIGGAVPNSNVNQGCLNCGGPGPIVPPGR